MTVSFAEAVQSNVILFICFYPLCLCFCLTQKTLTYTLSKKIFLFLPGSFVSCVLHLTPGSIWDCFSVVIDMGLVKSFAGIYWIFPETFNEKQSFVQYKHGPEVNLPHRTKLKCRLVPVSLTPSLFPDVIFLHLFFSPSSDKIFVPFCLHFRVSLLTSCLFFPLVPYSLPFSFSTSVF